MIEADLKIIIPLPLKQMDRGHSDEVIYISELVISKLKEEIFYEE